MGDHYGATVAGVLLYSADSGIHLDEAMLVTFSMGLNRTTENMTHISLIDIDLKSAAVTATPLCREQSRNAKGTEAIFEILGCLPG